MHNKKQITNWIDLTLSELSKLHDNKGKELLNVCGEACCESSSLFEGAVKIRSQYTSKESTDNLFNAYKQQYYNSSRLTKKGDTVTLIFEECTCPLVKDGVSNSFLCNCTVGYSKKIFETLFDKSVEVKLEKSILQGDKICEQIINIGK